MRTESRVRASVAFWIAIGLGLIGLIGLSGWQLKWRLSEWLASATANGAGNLLFLPFTVVLTVLVANWQMREQMRVQIDTDRQNALSEKRAQVEAHVDDARREVMSNLRYLRMLENYFWTGPGGRAVSGDNHVNTFAVAASMRSGIRLESLERTLRGDIRPYLREVVRTPVEITLERCQMLTLQTCVFLELASREITIVKNLEKGELASNYNGARNFYDVEFEFRVLCLHFIRSARQGSAEAALALGVKDEGVVRDATAEVPPIKAQQYLWYLNDTLLRPDRVSQS